MDIADGGAERRARVLPGVMDDIPGMYSTGIRCRSESTPADRMHGAPARLRDVAASPCGEPLVGDEWRAE